MTTSRPVRCLRPSRAQGFLGLLIGLLLVFLPLLHTHPAAMSSGPAGQVHSSCTLCAVFSGMETRATEPILVGLPSSETACSPVTQAPASAPGVIGVDGRAPPLPSV